MITRRPLHHGLKIAHLVAFAVATALLVTVPAFATPATFDFSDLGPATTGYKQQGHKFLVSEYFVNDLAAPTLMFLGSIYSQMTATIMADNVNVSSFDLVDMKFSPYLDCGIASLTILGSRAEGGIVSQLISNKTLTTGNYYQLFTDWGADLSQFKGITHLTFQLVMDATAGNDRVENLNFETITIDHVRSAATMTSNIASNNTNTLRAKIGDLVTVSMTTSTAISAPTVTIAGASAAVSGGGTAWSASYTMTSNEPEGPVNFSISYQDLAGYVGGASSVTTATDGSSVSFDKTAPTVVIDPPSVSLTTSGPVNYVVTYSDANFNQSTLSASDITLVTTATATGTVSVSGSGNTRTVMISGISGDGTLSIALASGTASDLAGNLAPAAGPSAMITVDNTGPSLNSSAQYVDATHVDVTFSEAVSGATSSFNYSANKGLQIVGAVLQSGTTYRIATGLQTVGEAYTITAIAVNIHDIAGNPLNSGSASALFTRPAGSNSAPSSPVIVAPAAGTAVSSLTPTLSLAASLDPDGDSVTYTYEIYSNSGMSSFVAGITGAGSSWVIPSALTENTTYYWRALATDGTLSSAWTNGDFFVNTVNDNPSAPAVSAPSNNSRVASLRPTISVTNAADPDKFDTVIYDFDVATDGAFANIISAASATGVTQGNGGTTSWTIPVDLSEDAPYYWRAQARDNNGGTSSWTSASFIVNASNISPTAPGVNSPAAGAETGSLTVQLSITNSADTDHDTLHYVFEADTVNTFNSGSKRVSGLVAEGNGTTSWTTPALSDNTLYFWRARANDGTTDGPWMTTGSFFVNTANDAPTAPSHANPANTGQVTDRKPALAVFASADADNDTLTYEFEVFRDSAMTSRVSSTSGAGLNWTTMVTLDDGSWYYWRARAVDSHGAAGPWSSVSSFFVNDHGLIGSGDMNGDYTVDATDALKALRIVAGLDTENAVDRARGDAAPLVGGKSQPDGKMDIGDVVIILRKAVGSVNW